MPNAIDTGQPILHLLDNRYIALEPDHPRRSYAYVRGLLKLYQGKPEVIVTSPEQITNWPITS